MRGGEFINFGSCHVMDTCKRKAVVGVEVRKFQVSSFSDDLLKIGKPPVDSLRPEAISSELPFNGATWYQE